MNTLRLAILAAVLSAFSLGLTAAHVSAEPPAAQKTKIGVILPLTGAFARYGEKIQHAVSAFANDSVTFVFEDEGCDPKMAVSAYKKLSEFDHVQVFLGPWCGSPQTAVAPQLARRKQVALLPSSAPEIVFTMSSGRMFSTQTSIEAESTFLAEKMNDAHVESVAIVYRNNQFSAAHESAFREHFKGKVFDTFTYISEDPAELKSIAVKVKQLNPAALYIPDAFPLITGFVHELQTLGIKDKKIYSVYSAQSDDVMKALGESAGQLIYSYPDIADEKDEALNHYPTMAAELLVKALAGCSGDADCVKDNLGKQNNFDKHGVLAGHLILKTVRHGKFVPLGGFENK